MGVYEGTRRYVGEPAMPLRRSETSMSSRRPVDTRPGEAGKCRRCVYLEPVGHTCDEGTRHRFNVEHRGRL